MLILLVLKVNEVRGNLAHSTHFGGFRTYQEFTLLVTVLAICFLRLTSSNLGPGPYGRITSARGELTHEEEP